MQRLNVAALAIVILAGCSSSDAGPSTAPVSGVVTFKGRPVEGASVVFYPRDTSSKAKPAQGVTDAEGKFSLRTHIQKQDYKAGAEPGDYVVTVSKTEQVEARENAMVPPKQLLPRKYLEPRTSPFKASVAADGTNNFEFPLE